MLAPVRESLANHEPIHWNRVYRLPWYVYFNHAVHIAKGVGCSTCHGRVDEMALTQQVAQLTMGWCVGCHRDPAPVLRPHDQIYNMSWQPPPNQAELGADFMRARHIDPRRLIECSICHR